MFNASTVVATAAPLLLWLAPMAGASTTASVEGSPPAPTATAPTRPTPASPPGQASALDPVLQTLVRQVLEANLEVAGAEATVAQRLAALDAARARYWPVLDLGVRYSRAKGGREIEIPVGDLLNPVYSTLNDLLAQNGQPPAFAPIQNASIPFLREEEQNSALLLTQPIFDPRIPAAKRAAEEQHLAAIGGLDALRGRLAREVKQAYYAWLGFGQATGILEVAAELARSNLAVNQSLFRNGKITEDLVFRAEADLLEIEQNTLDAQNAVTLAKAYVNLLRNEPWDRDLPSVAVSDGDVTRLRAQVAAASGSTTLDVNALQAAASGRRPELRQLDAVIRAASAGKDVAVAANSPLLGLAVDAGSQGTSFEVDSDALYVVASLVLRFNFFRGGADMAGIREAEARIDEVVAARQLAEQRIRVEVLRAQQEWAVASASLQTAAKRADAAAAGFRIAEKKRDLGQINQTEFIDARRTLTNAALNRNRTRFEALAALAGIEYATGVPPRPREEQIR